MRKRIKVTGFKDWDTMFYNNLLSIPVLFLSSLMVEDWSRDSLLRNLCVSAFLPMIPSHVLNHSQPRRITHIPPFRDRILRCSRCRDLIHHRLVHPRNKQYNLQHGWSTEQAPRGGERDDFL